jgi:hypothetical protein
MAVLVALARPCLAAPSEGPDDLDLALLREHKISNTAEALIDYLRKHSFDDDAIVTVKALVRQLGSEKYALREKASEELVVLGRLAVPHLEQALRDEDPEVVRRAQQCLSQIDRSDRPELSAAVLHCLARTRAPTAVPPLLRFAPQAEAPELEDDIIAALAACGIRDGKASPELMAALDSKQLARRVVAAGAIAQGQGAKECAVALRLLSDSAPNVRFRVAEGMLVRGERAGLGPLIALLADSPTEVASRVEIILCRLAGEKAADITSALGDRDEERRKWRDAWEEWRKKQEDKADLTRLHSRAPFLGNTLVPELYGGKVWECDAAGKVLWTIGGLDQPIDAQVLPNGRVLICERGKEGTHRLTERDRNGKIYWSLPVPNVRYVERLTNGNTLVGTDHRAWEITPGGKEVFAYESKDQRLTSMHRRPNGNLVCLAVTGIIVEVDRKGSVVNTVNLGSANWQGIQALPGNRYLAVQLSSGLVLELDRKGNKLWECQVPGATYAVRRPNGRTLVCSWENHRVVDVDPKGTIVWEKKVDSMAYRAHSR